MSAHEGYISFGGNEIINNARARGIAETAQCPLWWWKGPYCDSMADALGDEPYSTNTITDAPWFDPDDPDRSTRFFGAFAYSVSGVYDSTRSASVVEGVDNGGRVGRVRKGSRQVRVKALLAAQGADALEFGMAWLSAALDPGACGQHGDTCGSTDFEFFVDCPPARGTVQEFGPWVEARRNWNPNPSARGSVTGWATTAAVATLTATPEGGRVDVTANTSVPLFFQSADLPVAAGNRWSGAVEVTVPVGYPAVPLQLRNYAYGQNAAIGQSPVTTVQPGTTVRLEAPGTADATGVATGVRTILYGVGAPAGARFFVTDAIAERTAEVGDYFDGGTTAEDDFTQYRWLGAANASASVMETRQTVQRPQTDAEYGPIVDRHRRYLHNVVAVSGPLVTMEHEFRGFHAYEVEIVFVAERPWVYSVTRAVDLPTTASTVVEDIAHNLTPYPSAERPGEEVLTALNLSTNPSAEVNLTGWTSTYGVTSGADPGPFLAAVDRSGEKFAAGIWSVRRRLLGTATVASGRARVGLRQTMALGARPAGTRYSVNIWGAMTNAGGTGTALVRLDAVVEWLNAASASLRTDPLGETTTPAQIAEGMPFIAKSILPPVGATQALVYVRGEFDWASGPSPSDVRLYADALALTIP
ncbi:minor tail protein [Microbacterium phage Cressida]|uniref:Minor tail protein n=1 Tax=Microbacterium phage Cressida TaxID=2591216 RepID=A0A514DI32_9CAUD|nr:minor tail protein [Microbacterium phage Cressida]QDH93276.1 minor tail protein [Microbacterium phage Cressida]